MSAATLMAELTDQGFRLDAGVKGIRVSPAHKLTNSLRKTIQENREGLLALIAGKEPEPALPDDRALEEPTKPIEAVPRQSPKPTAKESTPKPVLCVTCRCHGYPTCVRCALANDPGLALENGYIFKVRHSTPYDPRVPWFCKLGL